ncbi:SDR family oxidoreductase [Marinifilum fragile]|uniref:SDR family NAD(P)-dependent oxidoreductase n=1 Tax=Marinifilum fragile TaxID=570161 RepID=UPI002AA89268|nr:SDR family oxidoreductase [Marinifilum fragile]
MSNKLLENKICLVTGAAHGIGKAIVERFAADGAIVYANDLKEQNMDQWAKECSEKYNTIVKPLYFDVCDNSAVKTAVMQIKKEQGRIDVLVNNAGIVTYEFLGMIDSNKLKKMFEVNVFALINLLQLVSRLMTRQKDGSIINMASIVGDKGAKGQLSYSASKGAVISTTKSAAKELASNCIRVNAVAPGMVGTERLKNAMQNKFDDKVNEIGFGRLATPEEIADTCSFLASDRSKYITGQIIGVDGGFVL